MEKTILSAVIVMALGLTGQAYADSNNAAVTQTASDNTATWRSAEN